MFACCCPAAAGDRAPAQESELTPAKQQARLGEQNGQEDPPIMPLGSPSSVPGAFGAPGTMDAPVPQASIQTGGNSQQNGADAAPIPADALQAGDIKVTLDCDGSTVRVGLTPSTAAAPSANGSGPPALGAELKARWEAFQSSEELGNHVCGECGAPGPKWASSNLGVLVCIKCAGVHRKMGATISKMLSVNLDTWEPSQVEHMLALGGNLEINRKLAPQDPERPKLGPDASPQDRERLLRAKYAAGPATESDASAGNQAASSDIGMVEFLGVLKVTVLRGKDLAVGDVLTRNSDPYVILKLGRQEQRTKTVYRALNPTWNESVMLSVPNARPFFEPLHLSVFDQDMITDDPLGTAEVEYGSFIESEGASGAGSSRELKVDLQNVESGSIDLKLEWIPLAQ